MRRAALVTGAVALLALGAVGGWFEGVTGLTSFGEMHVRHNCYIGVAPLPGGYTNGCVVTEDRDLFRTPPFGFCGPPQPPAAPGAAAPAARRRHRCAPPGGLSLSLTGLATGSSVS